MSRLSSVLVAALSELQRWSPGLSSNHIHPPVVKAEEEEEEDEDEGKLLFSNSSIKTEDSEDTEDSDHMTSSLSKFLDPDPQPGPSDPSEETQGTPDGASGNGLLDCIDVEQPLSEVVDSYICTICGRAFAQRGHWAKHVQVHRKAGAKSDRSFTCDLCGKRLTRFDGYQKHMRVHTGEKPYSCQHCGRRFSDNSNYKRHMRLHMGRKEAEKVTRMELTGQ